MLLKWVISGDEKQVATLCGMGGDRAGIERKQNLLCEPVSPGSGQQPAQPSALLYSVRGGQCRDTGQRTLGPVAPMGFGYVPVALSMHSGHKTSLAQKQLWELV